MQCLGSVRNFYVHFLSDFFFFVNVGNRWKPFSVGHFVAHRHDPGKWGILHIFPQFDSMYVETEIVGTLCTILCPF